MLDPVNVKYFKLSTGKIKKDSPSEISCCCVSCGEQRNRLHLVHVQEGNYDYVKCFNEGCELSTPTTMRNFLSIASPQYYEQYKRETFKGVIKTLKNEVSLKDIMTQIKDKPVKSVIEIKEIPLDKLFKKAKEVPACVSYLESRNIKVQEDWYFSTKKFFEYEGNQVYLLDFLLIPIYTIQGDEKKYRGFYSRSIKLKQFSTMLLPNTEKLWVQNPFSSPDIITEGVFDGISSGFDNPAAMLGAGLSRDYTEALSRETIIATDNDKTGIQKAKEFLDLGFRVFIWPDVKEKDFNEMLQVGYSKIEIKKFILDNTFQGIMGKIKLGIKEK
ncbi:MAG: hypothetical protein J7L15_04860 [Clostridiales bacterium]|nr:hypothetical protein [Clostridiales bacterium]